MSYGAGIDLGTTFTAAAISRRGEGRPEIVSLGGHGAAVPSVVVIRDDGTVLTGDAAERRSMLEPDRVAREFKRRLGDPTPLLLGGTPHSAESLQAKLLRSVVDSVTQLEGATPAVVVVTYPANWGGYRKELLTQTLRMAGLEDAMTVTEPEAAAIHYASQERVEPGEVVAVYDLGGGTFDAAVLRKTDDGFEILGEPEGLEHLGGVDFDHSVLQHVNAALDGALERLDLDDADTRADLVRLRGDCASAKEALSGDTEVSIPVSIAGTRTEVRLTRAELDEMVRPAIDETINALRRAIASTGLEVGEVNRVLLVGGASRMPIVSRTVAAELGRPVSLDAHPKHAIALGAAGAAAAGVERGGPVPPIATPPSEADARDARLETAEAEPPPSVTARRRRVPVALRRPARGAVLGAIAAMLVMFVTVYALFLRPTAEAAGVLYQDPVSKGPSPFTEPAVVETSITASPQTSASAGGEPKGPFGGSGVLTKCDKTKLVEFLNKNPDRRRAWTRVLGVPDENFEQYVESLREATLTVDTRVTNHGFKNGKAFSLQSILAKGTAVLIDRDGEIVTRCYCGNPLTKPFAVGTSTCNGCPRGYVPPPACTGAGCYQVMSSGGDSDDRNEGTTVGRRTEARRSTRANRAATPSDPGPSGGNRFPDPQISIVHGDTNSSPNEGSDDTGGQQPEDPGEPEQVQPPPAPTPEPTPPPKACPSCG